jgi:membrane protein CcdC involved in cytochrome C biogenesis
MAFRFKNYGGTNLKSRDSDIDPENEKGILKTFIKTMKKRFIKWISSSKGRIEILWSVMAGMLFSMLPLLVSHKFHIGKWFEYFVNGWKSNSSLNYIDEFIFGFIFTLTLIWSIKKYRVKSQRISRTDSQDDLMDKIRQSLKMTPEEYKRLIEEHTFEEMEKEEKARKG